jgi:hypothetical protein
VPDLTTGATSTVTQGCPCPGGFTCVGGSCALDGTSSPLQITLSWDDPEDLALHVREPQASQSSGYCEIFYGNVGPQPNGDGGPSDGCTPVGWLDEASDSSCAIDGINVDNVLYPASATPPSGTYGIYVDFYEDCSEVTSMQYSSITFALQVRSGNVVSRYCSQFPGGTSDFGSEGSGTLIASFTLP